MYELLVGNYFLSFSITVQWDRVLSSVSAAAVSQHRERRFALQDIPCKLPLSVRLLPISCVCVA